MSTRNCSQLLLTKMPKVNIGEKKESLTNGAQNREITKEEIKIVKKYLSKCSSSLVVRKMQTKTALRFHRTPERVVKIKNTTSNTGQNVVKRESSVTLVEF